MDSVILDAANRNFLKPGVCYIYKLLAVFFCLYNLDTDKHTFN